MACATRSTPFHATEESAATMRPQRMDRLALDIDDLRIGFRAIAGTTRAVNGVSLDVGRGEIVGLVGESGCGKSVTARSVLGLLPSPPADYEAGEIWVQTRGGPA